MPMDKNRYPVNWDAISREVRERAGQKCEQCGVPNGARIIRSSIDPQRYMIFDYQEFVYTWPDGTWIRMSELPEEYDGREVKVVLTVHHVGVDKPDGTPGDPHDKQDCRSENLQALCQRCHLLADLDGHMQRAKVTRLRKQEARRAERGEVRLF
jgi:5-methylcytosine-specific restriction endonuclease McrA